MKRFASILLSMLLTSCAFTMNMFKGPDDFTTNYLAGHLKEGIDQSIEEEIARHPPNGYLTKPYSRELWNRYWNDRIDGLHGLDNTSFDGSYRGPTGPEFISYFIYQRRIRNLPEISIEPRNQGRVPKSARVTAAR